MRIKIRIIKAKDGSEYKMMGKITRSGGNITIWSYIPNHGYGNIYRKFLILIINFFKLCNYYGRGELIITDFDELIALLKCLFVLLVYIWLVDFRKYKSLS